MEKISGEFEFFDEHQFALNLAAGTGFDVSFSAAIALAKAFPCAVTKERIHGLALGNGIAGKFVAEIVEREFKTRGKFESIGDGLGQVREKVVASPVEISSNVRSCASANDRLSRACGDAGWR